MTHRILVTCAHVQRRIERYREFLERHDIEVEMPAVEQQLSEHQLLELIGGFDAVIAGDDFFTERVLVAGEQLRMIAKWGVGVDRIDLAAALRLGIKVTNTPGVFADEVADAAMGYVVSLARRLHEIDRAVRRGQWSQPSGCTLRGQTIGIVGLGHIGQALSKRALAFGMKLTGYDPVPPSDRFVEATEMKLLTLDDLIPVADFLVLCCRSNPENREMIDRSRLRKMKEGVFVINVARGALIDEDALAEGLASGHVAGVALDVYQIEPLPEASPLRSFENCILGAHNGSNTEQAVDRVNRLVLQQVVDGLVDGCS